MKKVPNHPPEPPATQARKNPQAYACLGITLLAGFVGVFFGIFLTDFSLRITIAGGCFILFVAGICGHSYFKKQELAPEFRPSDQVRRLLGLSFGLSILGSLAFAAYAVFTTRFLDATIPAVYAFGIFPFVRNLLKEEKKTPEPTPPSIT